VTVQIHARFAMTCFPPQREISIWLLLGNTLAPIRHFVQSTQENPEVLREPASGRGMAEFARSNPHQTMEFLA
jgi:hypothetical protein